MDIIGRVTNAMIDYYTGDVRRVNHFLKVYGFAKTIGVLEGLDARTQEILELAALTHDIGIRNSERKYQSSAGHYQQLEGPPEARAMLEKLGVDGAVIERVCWLIARHHTYTDIQGADYQILVEADFLVNACEGEMSPEDIEAFRNKLFRTASGIAILEKLYE